MNITDKNLARIYIKARELYERALITEFTPSSANPIVMEERLITVQMAALDLAKELGLEEKK